MLSNFETQKQKLLQLILAGQPYLEKAASPGLDQLRKSIWIFAHLKPFSREETQL
jgi:type II secretory pathway predicted ATPase ExeA